MKRYIVIAVTILFLPLFLYAKDTCYSVALLSIPKSSSYVLKSSMYPPSCKILDISNMLSVRCGCFDDYSKAHNMLKIFSKKYKGAVILPTYKSRFKRDIHITDKQMYAVQLFSALPTKKIRDILKYIPKNLRNKTDVVRLKRWIVGYYGKTNSKQEAFKELEKARSNRYKSAFIVIYHFTIIQKNRVKHKKISAYMQSNLVVKANKAYGNAEYELAAKYYKKLLLSGYKNSRLLDNLSYLYGMTGEFFQEKKILKMYHNDTSLIYAYAYGAAKSNRRTFYKELKPFIINDNNGDLQLLAGYYFENNHQLKKAVKFYKMAYDNNPDNKYIFFAFARSYDIIGEVSKALKLYKLLLPRLKIGTLLYKADRRRIIELGGSL